MGTAERKAREFARREEEILEVALALCARDDWESVTVEEIAQRAEVAKGTIYKHFESKDEIYARLAIRFHRKRFESFAAIDKRLPVVERFRRMTAEAWNVHLASKEMHRIFTYCSRDTFRSSLPAETAAALQQAEADAARPITDLIAEGVATGVFKKKPVELLIFGARAAFWGAVQIVWSGYLGKIDQTRYLKELTEFMLAGLMRPPPRA